MSSVSQEQRPLLKLARLRVRELKAIRALELPADGLGWGDEIPDVVLIGGPNGSGKTTLLAAAALAPGLDDPHRRARAASAPEPGCWASRYERR